MKHSCVLCVRKFLKLYHDYLVNFITNRKSQWNERIVHVVQNNHKNDLHKYNPLYI